MNTYIDGWLRSNKINKPTAERFTEAAAKFEKEVREVYKAEPVNEQQLDAARQNCFSAFFCIIHDRKKDPLPDITAAELVERIQAEVLSLCKV